MRNVPGRQKSGSSPVHEVPYSLWPGLSGGSVGATEATEASFLPFPLLAPSPPSVLLFFSFLDIVYFTTEEGSSVDLLKLP